jgi:hypothetical protein
MGLGTDVESAGIIKFRMKETYFDMMLPGNATLTVHSLPFVG